MTAHLFNLVGVQGFEPWTPCSQSRCATGLRHTPKRHIIQDPEVSCQRTIAKQDNFLSKKHLAPSLAGLTGQVATCSAMRRAMAAAVSAFCASTITRIRGSV